MRLSPAGGCDPLFLPSEQPYTATVILEMSERSASQLFARVGVGALSLAIRILLVGWLNARLLFRCDAHAGWPTRRSRERSRL